MTEEKRGRGRPKKVTIAPVGAPEKETVFTSFEELRDYLKKEGVVIEDESKNPDCEPATKGFVKCIARESSKHTHPFDLLPCVGSIAISILICAIAVLLYTRTINAEFATVNWATVGVSCVFSLVLVAISTFLSPIVKMVMLGDCSTIGSASNRGAAFIKKYEPPKCEQKKECGED